MKLCAGMPFTPSRDQLGFSDAFWFLHLTSDHWLSLPLDARIWLIDNLNGLTQSERQYLKVLADLGASEAGSSAEMNSLACSSEPVAKLARAYLAALGSAPQDD